MKQREYILSLYEIYKNLLSNKEQSYFEYYYFEDYSLQEIASNYDVSRAYVSKYINSIEEKIIKYEDSLHINKKNNELRNIIKDLDENIKLKIENIIE